MLASADSDRSGGRRTGRVLSWGDPNEGVTMTMQLQPGSPSSGLTSQPPRWIRVGLTIALVVAVVAGILFVRSLGPLNKNYGVLGGAEAISLVAIIFLMTFGGSPWRTVIAALACVAAVIPSCEGLVFTYLPLAGPSMVDQAHPSPTGSKRELNQGKQRSVSATPTGEQ
jgi:hypothetical protein